MTVYQRRPVGQQPGLAIALPGGDDGQVGERRPQLARLGAERPGGGAHRAEHADGQQPARYQAVGDGPVQPTVPEAVTHDHIGRRPRRQAVVEVDDLEMAALRDTGARVWPYYLHEIQPHVLRGEGVLIAAHGNSLRALVKLLLDVSDEDIVGVEIPTGNPLFFEFDKGSLKPKAVRYLDETRAQKLPPIPGK